MEKIFAPQIEITEEENTAYIIKTPCFKDLQEDSQDESTTYVASKDSSTEENDYARLCNPSKIWTLTFIKILCWKQIVLGLFVPESSTKNLVGQVTYVYDLLICNGFFLSKQKIPIPISAKFIFASSEYGLLEFIEIKEFYAGFEKILQVYVKRIKVFRSISTVCLGLVAIGVIFLLIAEVLRFEYWEIAVILIVLPTICLLFYVKTIKFLLTCLNDKALNYGKQSVGKLKNLNVEIGMNCIYVNCRGK